RTVSERADVSLGTLYRYFPSEIHLLVSALTLEFERTQENLDRRPFPGDTPYERMMYVLSRVTRTMQREPMLTEAMTRAFMFADPSAAGPVPPTGPVRPTGHGASRPRRPPRRLSREPGRGRFLGRGGAWSASVAVSD